MTHNIEDALNCYHELISNVPNGKDLRLLHDDDLISSDEENSGNSDFPIVKYNQLNPKANLVHRLLQLAKPKREPIWKLAVLPNGYKQNLTKRMETSKKRKYEELSSDEERSQQKKSARISLGIKKVNHSTTHLHSISSSDEEYISVNKLKSHDQKQKTHSISSSNDENLDNVSPSISKQKPRNLISKKVDQCFSYNGHASNDESESPTKQKKHKHKANKNQQNDFDCDSVISFGVSGNQPNSYIQNGLENNNDGKGHVKPCIDSQSSSSSREKLYRERKFTDEDEEEISKFSSLLNDDFIEKNDIWLLQCPSQMEVTNLVNQYLNLNGSSQLKDGQFTYEAFSYRNDMKRLSTLAVPSERNNFRLCQIPLTGNIIVEESVKIRNNPSCNISEPPEYVEFPGNLRMRHPLLGINYEKQLGTTTKVKKKRRAKINIPYGNDLEEQQPDEVNEEIRAKRKKNKKRNCNDTF